MTNTQQLTGSALLQYLMQRFNMTRQQAIASMKENNQDMAGVETLEFRYTNRGPLPWAVQRTNVIRLRWDGDNLIESRHYVCNDGTFDDDGIVYVFDNTPDKRITADNVAKMIHWGCCGWSAGGHEIWELREKVAEFIETK